MFTVRGGDPEVPGEVSHMSGDNEKSRQDQVRPRVLQALPGELDLREREERQGALSLM